MHSKGNHQYNEKTNSGMGENICKWWDRPRINIQNRLTVHTTQYKKKKHNPIRKWTEDMNRGFPKEDTWKDAQHP